MSPKSSWILAAEDTFQGQKTPNPFTAQTPLEELMILPKPVIGDGGHTIPQILRRQD